MESDLALGPVTPTEQTFSVAGPLPYYFDTEAGHAAGRLSSHATNVFGYIGGFDAQIWMTIASVLLCLSTLLALYSSLKGLRTFLDHFYDYLFEMLGNLLLEASPNPVSDPHVRIVVSFWWLMLLVLMNTFTGHMKASMTVDEELPRLDTLQSVLDRKDIVPRVDVVICEFCILPEIKMNPNE
ncbi:glutamate receptor, putative [Ixodes scapularis]|uniref:Glutamate receptor, putative n=1 Tax=Ixodes scapularis TaxID=6945 RepID=B7Q294_IXOSC|nr:glutamate receptor, putative [Ixodes scapularis]|eukprot:XP_002410586.1 glutamate receptor, putative [Ixodes scapularis]